MTLEERALEWIAPYWNAEHLVRTRDWVLELEPDASEGLRLAALTHDMERHFPGTRETDLVNDPEEATEYRQWHAERSAEIVSDWLREQGADGDLVAEVRHLVAAHEVGGSHDADVLQAADSLSFFETNADLAASWYTSGRCSRERAKAQLTWMFERMAPERARTLGEPLYREALAVVDRA